MGISMPSLIIILVIVVLLFGTKRLKSIGSDLGGALKGFKKAVNDEDATFSQDKKQVGDGASEPVETSEKKAVKED